MQVEHPNARELTLEEQQELEKLKALMDKILADGKLSKSEIDAVRTMIHADGKVTVEELAIIRNAMRAMLGDAQLEYDWF